MGVISARLALICALLPGMAAAQTTVPSVTCEGTSPDWSLALTSDGASFAFIGQSEMDIPQISRAEGQIWPMALTLIDESFTKTAIVVLHERSCIDREDGQDVQVLTQRNEQPVLLSGCCLPLDQN